MGFAGARRHGGRWSASYRRYVDAAIAVRVGVPFGSVCQKRSRMILLSAMLTGECYAKAGNRWLWAFVKAPQPAVWGVELAVQAAAVGWWLWNL